jgi:hypothetical protein
MNILERGVAGLAVVRRDSASRVRSEICRIKGRCCIRANVSEGKEDEIFDLGETVFIGS